MDLSLIGYTLFPCCIPECSENQKNYLKIRFINLNFITFAALIVNVIRNGGM